MQKNVLTGPNFKYFLMLMGIVVVLTSLLYTAEIVEQLKEDELQDVELWAKAQKLLLNAPLDEAAQCNYELHHQIIQSNHNTPMILADENDQVIDAMNYFKTPKEAPEFFKEELQSLKQSSKHIKIEDKNYTQYIYYKSSTLISSLEIFPYIQFSILSCFLLLIMAVLQANRRAEQERIWVGMAKETAHQLGTPISSLMGWTQNMKLMYEQDENINMISNEIDKDIHLLKIVADRFSKIGTTPELEPLNIYTNLDQHLKYIAQRASRKIQFDFPDKETPPVYIDANPLLFDWVIENLLKNALDAMDGKGTIKVNVQVAEKYVYIDLSDTGKGIPSKNFKKVFEPGFSTKKRGWGLGLSLCKRIISNYHNGKIFVLKSGINEGTTFRIRLPYSNANSIL